MQSVALSLRLVCNTLVCLSRVADNLVCIECVTCVALVSSQKGSGKTGEKGKKGKPDKGSVEKCERHLLGGENMSEVLFIESWGEAADSLMKLAQESVDTNTLVRVRKAKRVEAMSKDDGDDDQDL